MVKETHGREILSETSFDARSLDLFPSAGSSLRVSLVIETPAIRTELLATLADIGAAPPFDMTAATPAHEVARAVERESPDVLVVETSRLGCLPAEWIEEVRRSGDVPMIIAVHTEQDPGEMIRALRGGAGEFLWLPLGSAFLDALDRVAAGLERKRTAAAQKGRTFGFLGAKGGCGTTSIACYTAAALAALEGPKVRSLVADLDTQASSTRSILGAAPKWTAFDAFEQVRRVSASSWRDTVARISDNLDLLAGPVQPRTALPEPWRIEALFRFMGTSYSYICVDLGRHVTPANWIFLQNIEELFLVTGPDVLALYQTRQILQTLSGRGFEKSRIRLILNLNQGGPQDFWKESIEQMFEMQVYFVLPYDVSRASAGVGIAGAPFEYPSDTDFGRHMMKLAGKISGVTVLKKGGSGLFRRG